MSSLEALFGSPKPVIAMLHLGALPGRPKHDRATGLVAIVDSVRRDLGILQDAGVDGVMFCNEADLPYQLQVGPEITAAMSSVVGQLRPEISIPFGVNLLWDPIASLAVARATGARFVREVMTGVYESDLGMIEPRIGEIAGYRSAIGAEDVLLFDNIQPEFASAVGNRTVAARARGAAFMGVDAILISGPAAEQISEIFRVADGAIVGTSLKVNGVTWNPVDPERARRLMEAARQARSNLAPA